jgi:uncharacterized membrane-anchored protein YitT (DUF2179 family)
MKIAGFKREVTEGAVALTPPGAVRGWNDLLRRHQIRDWLKDMVFIVAGCLVFVLGMNALLIPHQLIAGGLTGAALLLHYAIPFFDVGLWYFFLNIPLLWLGWRKNGRRFMLLTAFGMTVFSLAASWISVAPLAVYDPITAAHRGGGDLWSGGGPDIAVPWVGRRP